MVLHLLSLAALAAQAMTAYLVPGRRSMDWAGDDMLACITALGGGTIRDVPLGYYPLLRVQNSFYLGLTAIAPPAAHCDRAAGASAHAGLSRARRSWSEL